MYAPTAVMAAVAPVKITVLLLRREVVIMIVVRVSGSVLVWVRWVAINRSGDLVS